MSGAAPARNTRSPSPSCAPACRWRSRQEFDTWRKIRDSDGSEGWVFHSLLSGKRTALVAPWEKGGPFPARLSADAQAAVVAYLQPRVITDVEECTGIWCRIAVKGYEGWIEQDRLWGVYPNEVFQQ